MRGNQKLRNAHQQEKKNTKEIRQCERITGVSMNAKQAHCWYFSNLKRMSMSRKIHLYRFP